MASDRDTMLYKLGLDAGGLVSGTARMMDQQKRAASEYVSVWETALSKREAAEVSALEKQAMLESKANDASLAKLEANLEAKAVATKVFFEEQASQYEIAQGSIGSGMLVGGAGKVERGAVRSGESGLLEGAEIGGGSMIGMGALRGGMTAVRGAAVGSWNLIIRGMISALTRLGLTTATLLSSIPIVGAALAAGLGMSHYAKQMGAADKESRESGKEIEGQRAKIAERLDKEIIKLQEAGKLTKEQRIELEKQLGTTEGILFVRRQLAPLLPEGFETPLPRVKTDTEKIIDADKLADRYQKQLDKKKDEFKLEKDIVDKTEGIAFLRKSLNELDKNSVEYHEARARLLGDEVDLAADLVQQAQQLKSAGVLAAGSTELAKAQAEAGQRWKENQVGEAVKESSEIRKREKNEMKVPELEEMASGGGWLTRKKKQYGRGGIYDLTAGPLKGMARDYISQQYGMTRDMENYVARTGKSDWLSTKQGKSEESYLKKLGAPLQALGMLSEMSMKDIANHTELMSERLVDILAQLRDKGVLINTV